MMKIIEIKTTITDENLIDNIFDCQNLINKINNKVKHIDELNFDEYKFINTVMEKTKNNLEKVYQILKL